MTTLYHRDLEIQVSDQRAGLVAAQAVGWDCGEQIDIGTVTFTKVMVAKVCQRCGRVVRSHPRLIKDRLRVKEIIKPVEGPCEPLICGGYEAWQAKVVGDNDAERVSFRSFDCYLMNTCLRTSQRPELLKYHYRPGTGLCDEGWHGFIDDTAAPAELVERLVHLYNEDTFDGPWVVEEAFKDCPELVKEFWGRISKRE